MDTKELYGLEWVAFEIEQMRNPVPKWFSVNELLPQCGAAVLCWLPKAKDQNKYRRNVAPLALYKRYEGSSSYYWDNEYSGGNLHLFEAVSHWAVIPEPDFEEPFALSPEARDLLMSLKNCRLLQGSIRIHPNHEDENNQKLCQASEELYLKGLVNRDELPDSESGSLSVTLKDHGEVP